MKCPTLLVILLDVQVHEPQIRLIALPADHCAWAKANDEIKKETESEEWEEERKRNFVKRRIAKIVLKEQRRGKRE